MTEKFAKFPSFTTVRGEKQDSLLSAQPWTIEQHRRRINEIPIQSPSTKDLRNMVNLIQKTDKIIEQRENRVKGQNVVIV